MGYPPQPPQDPSGWQPDGQSGPQHPYQPYQPLPYTPGHMPVPSGPQFSPVQFTTVRERGFNPVTFGVHLCLWIFVHSWLTVFTIGFWLLVAIPVTFLGWRVTRTVPVQHFQQPPYPPQGY